MQKSASYDVVVIGAGSAGFSAAEAARAEGASVCMIEREKLGGECPNWACVPSKAFLRTAKAMREVARAGSFGVKTGAATFSFPEANAYRGKAVSALTGGGERGVRYEQIARKIGVDIVYGSAAFTDPGALDADGRRIIAKAFVIAVGTNEFIPPIPGLADIAYLTSRTVPDLDRPPKSIAIVGGGPVGCEYATFFSAIGTRTVLIQGAETVLNREDPEIAALAEKALRANGVEVLSGAKILEVINGRGGVYGLKVEMDGKTATHAVETVMVTAGKRGATGMLALENAGVMPDERGFVMTDERSRTAVPHIFAAGDADGGLMFTHTAHHEGSVAGRNAARYALGKRSNWSETDERVVPRVTFVDPEVASVGMTEMEAKAAWKKALVGRFPISALGRAVTDGVHEGMVKIVAHPKTRRVVGCHIMAERAGEMIHEAALAIHLRTTVDKLGSMIHAYPTYSEALLAAANSVILE